MIMRTSIIMAVLLSQKAVLSGLGAPALYVLELKGSRDVELNKFSALTLAS
jgi:hypothetical protein